MNRLSSKKVNNLYAIILLVSAIIAFIGGFTDKTVLVIIGIIAMIANLVFRWICFRCPHCGRYLDRSSGDFCPYCGKEVNE